VITIVGCLADSLGAASQVVAVPYSGPGRTFDVKREFSSTPSTEYRSVQAAAIAVDVNHDRLIVGHAGVHGDVASLLARLEAESGHLEKADDLITSARPWLERMSGTAFLHVSLRRAAVARARGDHAGAQAALSDACDRVAASHFLTLHGETLEDAGELGAALAVFERKGDVASAARTRSRLELERWHSDT
jgi:hypothetical protein